MAQGKAQLKITLYGPSITQRSSYPGQQEGTVTVEGCEEGESQARQGKSLKERAKKEQERRNELNTLIIFILNKIQLVSMR